MIKADGTGNRAHGRKERNARVRLGAWGLWCCAILLIFAFSSQPYRVQNIQPLLQKALSPQRAERLLPAWEIRYDGKTYRKETNPYGYLEFLFRKGAHLFMYATLAAATAFALRLARRRGRTIVLLALLAVAVIAVLDEWNQQYSPARTPAWQDVLVDLTGGLLGLAVFFVFRRVLP